MSSKWEQYDIENKIIGILSSFRYASEEHYGQPYVTPYQIAIEFFQRYPEDAAAIGLPIGGKGAGGRNSFSQYIALELSKRVKSGNIEAIEMGFLHTRYMRDMAFETDKLSIEASAPKTSYDISVYRLRE